MRIKLLKRVVIIICIIITVIYIFFYKTENKNLSKSYIIGVFLNDFNVKSNTYLNEKKIIDYRIKLINSEGGINGIPIKAEYLNCLSLNNSEKKLFDELIQNENLLGFVGCSISTNAKKIIDTIAKYNIPWLGDFSIIDETKKYNNIFSLEISMKDELDIFESFLKNKFHKPLNLFFIGQKEDLYTKKYYERILDLRKNKIIKNLHSFWLNYKNNEDLNLDYLIDSITENFDFIAISLESKPTADIINALSSNKINIPVFPIFGDIGNIVNYTTADSISIYDINVVGIPNASNLRIAKLKKMYKKLGFEFNPASIGIAGKYSDAIGILINCANDNYNMPLKNKILKSLNQFKNNKKIFKGWFADYSFSDRNFRTGNIFIAWKPLNKKKFILYPYQFSKSEHYSNINSKPVIYSNIFMKEISRIDDLDKSFFADFYLEIISPKHFYLNKIKFTNSSKSSSNHKSLLDYELILKDSFFDEMKFYHYYYKISGKFYFQPDNKDYPFDKQKLEIIFQPKDASNSFYIQPIDNHNDLPYFQTQGWTIVNHYVGYNQEIIRSNNNFSNKHSFYPLYKFNYTYILKRSYFDFYLKIIIPLVIILLVTYISSFISLRFFDAIAGVQVTSLLSSIALYFSLHQPYQDTITVSDLLFIGTYFLITTMMASSVIILYQYRKNKSTFYSKIEKNIYYHFAFVYQRIVFPIFLFFIGFYITVYYIKA